MEYRVLESRIIDGALADLLANQGPTDRTPAEDGLIMNDSDIEPSEVVENN